MAATKPRLETDVGEAPRERRLRFYAYMVGLLILAAGALDCVSTELALSTGIAFEANPVIRAFQDWTGPYWVAPKMLLHLLLATALVASPSRAGLAAMSVVATLTLGAALNNLAIYQTFMDKSL